MMRGKSLACEHILYMYIEKSGTTLSLKKKSEKGDNLFLLNIIMLYFSHKKN